MTCRPRAACRLAAAAVCGAWLLSASLPVESALGQPAAEPSAGRTPTAAAELHGEAAGVRRVRRQHDRNLAVAQQLIDELLADQLRRLRQNGLSDHPLYVDISRMHSSLQQLREEAMEDVSALLEEAEQTPEGLDAAAARERRDMLLGQARSLARETARRLLGERQLIQQRLQENRLVEDLRQLVVRLGQQRTAIAEVRSLPQAEQETEVFRLLQSGEDLRVWLEAWTEDARRLEQTAGPVAAQAAAAAEILRRGDTEPLLDASLQSVGGRDWPAADQALRQTEAVWTAALASLRSAAETSSWSEALAEVSRLVQDQQAAVQTAEGLDWNDLDRVDAAATAQQQLHQRMLELQPALAADATLTSWLQAAQTAALDAAAELFQGGRKAASRRQGDALDSLRRVEDWLKQAVADSRIGRSAAELKAEAFALTNLLAEVRELRQAAEQDPSQANLTDRLRQLGERTGRWDWIEARRQEAVSLAAGQATAEPSGATTSSLVDAVDQLLAEVATRRQDALREQRSVNVGELARASEAIERIAAALRKGAADFRSASEQADDRLWRSARRQAEQSDEAIGWLQQAVAAEAPAAAELLNEAQRRLRQSLAAPRPNDDSPAAAAAQGLQSAAETLQAAAVELRRVQLSESSALADLAETQRAEIGDLAERLRASAADVAVDDRQAAWDAFRRSLREAWQWQLEACGDAQSAAHDRWLAALADVEPYRRRWERAVEVRSAEQAEQEWAALESNLQTLQEIAQRRQWQERFRTAATLATSAAAVQQAALRGDSRLLRSDLAAWRADFAALTEDSAGVLPVASHPRSLPPQRESLTTLQRSQAAFQSWRELARGAGEAAVLTPEAIGERAALEKFSSELAAAVSAALAVIESWPAAADPPAPLAEQQDQSAERLAALIEYADRLQDIRRDRRLARSQVRFDALPEAYRDALDVDAAAAAALRRTAAGARPENAAAIDRLQLGLQQAGGSLALREARVRHDLNAAKVMMQSVEQQATALEALRSEAETLRRLIEAEPDSRADGEAEEAARRLREAAQAFAASLDEIGRRAVAISGQRDVANPALKQALAAASGLSASRTDSAEAAGAMPGGGAEAAAEPVDAAASPTEDAQQSPGDGDAATTRPGAADADAGAAATESGQTPPQPLGEGLIPNSPAATARQIAGDETMQQAERREAAGDPRAADGNPAAGQSGRQARGTDAAPEDTAAMAAESNARAEGRSALGEDADPAAGPRDADLWLLRLPESWRQQLRSRPRQQAPTGYQERMQRYFGGR